MPEKCYPCTCTNLLPICGDCTRVPPNKALEPTPRNRTTLVRAAVASTPVVSPPTSAKILSSRMVSRQACPLASSGSEEGRRVAGFHGPAWHASTASTDRGYSVLLELAPSLRFHLNSFLESADSSITSSFMLRKPCLIGKTSSPRRHRACDTGYPPKVTNENRIVPDILLRRGVQVRLRACRVSAGSAVAGRR